MQDGELLESPRRRLRETLTDHGVGSPPVCLLCVCAPSIYYIYRSIILSIPRASQYAQNGGGSGFSRLQRADRCVMDLQ